MTIIIRDQTTISTHFTNPRTAEIVRPKISELFNCDLEVKKADAEQNCTIMGKENKLKRYKTPGINAEITLDPEYQELLVKKKKTSRFTTDLSMTANATYIATSIGAASNGKNNF